MGILKYFKSFSFAVACLNLVISPLAVAAQAQQSNVAIMKEFLKTSGLTQRNVTVGQFYRNILPHLSAEAVAKLNPYFLLTQDEIMPTVQPVTFIDKNKIEQVRLSVDLGGKTYSFQTEGAGKNLNLKFNSYTFAPDAWKHPNMMFNGMAKEAGLPKTKKAKVLSVTDLKLAPSKEVWSHFTKEQRFQFLIMARYLVDDIQKVLPPVWGKKTVQNEAISPMDKFALVFEMLNPEACAGGKKGKSVKNSEDGGGAPSGRCVVAGWVSKYGSNGYCGGRPDGRIDLDEQQETLKQGLSKACPSSNPSKPAQVTCNPIFYGFNDGGAPYCVPETEINYATKNVCNDVSKLRRGGADEVDDVKRILNSFLQDRTHGRGIKGAQRNKNGNIELTMDNDADFKLVQDHLKLLEDTFKDALTVCDAQPGEPSADYQINQPSKLMNIENQKSACEGIVTRYIALKQIELAPPLVPYDPGKDTQQRETGCPMQNNKCACPPVSAGPVVAPPPTTQTGCGEIVVTPPPPHVEDRPIAVEDPKPDDAGFCQERDENGGKHMSTLCSGLIFGGLLAAAFLVIKHGSQPGPVTNPTYDPAPTPVNGPVAGPGTPVVPVVTPPTNPPVAPVPPKETTSTLPSTVPAAGTR